MLCIYNAGTITLLAFAGPGLGLSLVQFETETKGTRPSRDRSTRDQDRDRTAANSSRDPLVLGSNIRGSHSATSTVQAINIEPTSVMFCILKRVRLEYSFV